MKELGRELINCIICNGNLTLVLNLGQQPLANEYLKDNKCNRITYPLKLMSCEYCFHKQLSYAVNPGIMFSKYTYVSGTSITGKIHFHNFAKKIGHVNKVLDIACNDGSQLDAFSELYKDIITVGVDPAENLKA